MEIFYTIIDKEGFPIERTDDGFGIYLSRVSLNECPIFNNLEKVEKMIYTINYEWDNGYLSCISGEFPLRVAKVKQVRRLLEIL